MLPLLIAALLGLSGVVIVAYPLLGLQHSGVHVPDEPGVGMAESERVARRALLDVDFDYRLGNLDRADYLALRDRYEERALAALKTRYEREHALDALIDEQLASLRTQKRVFSGRTRSSRTTANKPARRAGKPAAADGPQSAGARGIGVRHSVVRRRKGV